MKTLLIMRHAKSSWKEEGSSDHERPLNDRGKRDAPRMGRWLEQQGIHPDAILCSSAKRAKKTAKLLATAMGCTDCIAVHKELYTASPGDYLSLLSQLPATIQTALIIAHDPTVSHFVSTYADAYTQMPTAAIACFDVDIDAWQAFNAGTQCTLRDHWVPKSLPSEV